MPDPIFRSWMNTAPRIKVPRTEAEKRRDEAGYRKGVLHPSPTWQKHFKAAVKNGSAAELRRLVKELRAAVDRLDRDP